MNFSNLKQARELKSKLDRVQKELSNLTIEADAGKGAVRVTVDGQQRVKSIEISTEVMDPEKPKRLEELLLKAINKGLTKSQKEASKQLRELTGGLKLPGLL